jgi:8-oxo-dGTP diphosphatase
VYGAVIDDPWEPPPVLVAVDLVILTLRASALHVLLVQRGIEPHRGELALPGGFLQHSGEGLLTAARRELHEEADLDAARLHLEQLGAYGEPDRDPRGRVVSIAYLAIAPGLPEPTAGTDAAGACWRPVDAILSERTTLSFDHAAIVADGVERARAKLENSALATAFCAETFTISDLRLVYEAVWGVRLDPGNFYRRVLGVPGFITSAGSDRRTTKGRPAQLFQAGPATVLHPPLTRPHPPQGRKESR